MISSIYHAKYFSLDDARCTSIDKDVANICVLVCMFAIFKTVRIDCAQIWTVSTE